MDPSAERPDSKEVMLNNLINETAKAQGYKLEQLPKEYQRYFVELKAKEGDRCVDGRTILLIAGYSKENYLGRQFPGGTLGTLDAVRKIMKLNEEDGRKLVKNTYDKSGFKMGDHIDDKHKGITDPEELKNRKKGCGNQQEVSQSHVEIYEDLEVTEELAEERIDWLRENGGDVYILSGEHTETGAILNMNVKTTFNAADAAENDKAMFNIDGMAAYDMAGLLFDEAKESGIEVGMGKEEFQKELLRTMLTDYLQTLTALGYQEGQDKKVLYLNN